MTAQTVQILRSLDKQDRVGEAGVIDLLTNGRRDESGDFTPGCGLSVAQAVTLLGLLKCVNATFNPDHEGSVLVARRFALIEAMESAVNEKTGRTAWDELIDMRPANVAWALDDIWRAYEQGVQEQK